METLGPGERRVLSTLAQLGGVGSPEEIREKGGFRAIVEVMNACSWLQSKGLVRIEDSARRVVFLGKEGRRAVQEGLPERRVLPFLLERYERGESVRVEELSGLLDPEEVPVAIGWLRRKGLAEVERRPEGPRVILLPRGVEVARSKALLEDESLLQTLLEKEVSEEEIDPRILSDLRSRKGMLSFRDEIRRTIRVTSKGRALLEGGLSEEPEGIGALTHEVLVQGAWRSRGLRPYDVHAYAPTLEGGKPHPLRELIEEIREIFLRMGFQEIEGGFVSNAFWDLDALFVPQDHPAREMQDTFYLERPERTDLSNEPYVSKVRLVHENGGGTGSKGWRTKWRLDLAERTLLRTHTTLDTLRALKEHPDPPLKVFSVDRVFRNERLDSTHLPEFHQVEGVVHEKGANLRMLVSLLEGFYRELGAEGVRVRPAYFPYTEPSLEVEVFYQGSWMELGGAGIFRPEVTYPLGIRNPVLAWGLGLERLAMIRFGLSDVRALYLPDLDWLRRAPLR